MSSPKIWIYQRPMKLMFSLAQEHAPFEVGGMLVGYEATNGDTVVTHVIGPGPGAIHHRFSFSPDSDYQQLALEVWFRDTGGRETYLGDWHTHPGGSPMPSLTDKQTLARIASTESSGTRYPVMVILAGEADSWRVGAVRFLSARRRFFSSRYTLVDLVYAPC